MQEQLLSRSPLLTHLTPMSMPRCLCCIYNCCSCICYYCMQITTGVEGYEGFSHMHPPSLQQLALDAEAPEGAPLPDPGGNLQVINLLCLHVAHPNDSMRQPPLCILRQCVCVCGCVRARKIVHARACVCVCVCVCVCARASREAELLLVPTRRCSANVVGSAKRYRSSLLTILSGLHLHTYRWHYIKG